MDKDFYEVNNPHIAIRSWSLACILINTSAHTKFIKILVTI